MTLTRESILFEALWLWYRATKPFRRAWCKLVGHGKAYEVWIISGDDHGMVLWRCIRCHGTLAARSWRRGEQPPTRPFPGQNAPSSRELQ